MARGAVHVVRIVDLRYVPFGPDVLSKIDDLTFPNFAVRYVNDLDVELSLGDPSVHSKTVSFPNVP